MSTMTAAATVTRTIGTAAIEHQYSTNPALVGIRFTMQVVFTTRMSPDTPCAILDVLVRTYYCSVN